MAMLNNHMVYLLNLLGVFLGMSVWFMDQTGGLSNYQVMGCSWCCTHMQLRRWFVLLIFVVGDPEPKIVWSFVIYSTELSNFLGITFYAYPIGFDEIMVLALPGFTVLYFNILQPFTLLQLHTIGI